MIPRVLAEQVQGRRQRYPVVTITGPRQSGKTTLCRAVASDLSYASLEAPDVRRFALEDPRGFLGQYPDGAVLDEVQRAPELLSYLQGLVDERGVNGRWVLTGSQNFALVEGLSQSLAGRTAVLNLLPFELLELQAARPTGDLFETLLAGGYPRIHDQAIPPREFHADYVATYVERDVRQLLNVGDLTAFQTFLRVVAGRSGQLVNLSALGADVGVSYKTARAWLSVLEAGYLVLRLPPRHRNVTKRVVKAHKLHFLDSGLLCFLLGIQEPGQLLHHPLRGAIFESWVASEIWKTRAHRGLASDLSFYRDRRGTEVDLVLERGGRLTAIEVKSGGTVAPEFQKPLTAFTEQLEPAMRDQVERFVVYGGDREERRSETSVIPWTRVGEVARD